MPTSDPPSPIRRLREAAGWTQAELARRVGLTRQAFCRMEGGAWLPNTAVALRLARELGTSVEDLFGGGTETELRADPQAPRSPRLELARVREETCASPPRHRPPCKRASDRRMPSRPRRARDASTPSRPMRGPPCCTAATRPSAS